MAKARKKSSKRKSRARKNPALISAKELGYSYEDGIRNFDGSALVGQNLSGMVLRNASFRNANLYGVNFSGADLRGVDFTGADMGSVNMESALLSRETNLTGVNAEGAKGTPVYEEGFWEQGPAEAIISRFGAVRKVPMPSREELQRQMEESEAYLLGKQGTVAPGEVPKMRLSDAPSSGRIFSPGPRVEVDGKVVEVVEPLIHGMTLDEAIEEMRKAIAEAGYDLSEHEIIRYDQLGDDDWAPFFITNFPWFSEPHEFWMAINMFPGFYLDDGGDEMAAFIEDPKPGEPRPWADYLKARKQLMKAKANPRRRKTPEWKRLIDRCHRLWEAYDAKPLKKNLVAFGDHIEKMKASKSAKVKAEARRAMRAYSAEFKARGWKS